ncbi:hypothetical protein FSP39_003962 [Pinctada imbricata]|uniref:Uncharacterized protein n=1 Tax=Pinctada imbricata TaxID=66713 RepID=A0AA89C230_PINIB|nr:hypothetical protein FSP39_003962 [Pinctada imbricata]
MALNQGAMALNEGVLTLNQVVLTLNQDVMTLDQDVMTLDQGVMTLNQGAMTLNQGVMTLDQDVMTLDQGVMTLNQGTMNMNQGIMTLNQGAMTLNKGIMTLNQGAMTLNQGVMTFKFELSYKMSGWEGWAKNVEVRHCRTAFCGIYGLDGSLYTSIGDQSLAGQPNEVQTLLNLPAECASDEVCANGIRFGNFKYTYLKSIEAKEGMPSCLHFFNRKVDANEKIHDDEKYVLCVLKCNSLAFVAIGKGGNGKDAIVNAVCVVAENLHGQGY